VLVDWFCSTSAILEYLLASYVFLLSTVIFVDSHNSLNTREGSTDPVPISADDEGTLGLLYCLFGYPVQLC
jgi:hypothetical protein